MPDPQSLRTAQMHAWLERIRAGDREACDELIRASCRRLERLARRMLRDFANLRPLADTGDVLNGALLRLVETLQKLDPPPPSARDYYALAACHVRRELIDLARYYGRAKRGGGRPVALAPTDSDGRGIDPPDPAADSPDALESWARFHEAVEGLPAEQREVVGLKFYHGWGTAEIAELLGLEERTCRRRWRDACLALSRILGEAPPVE
ncbi:MAG TPA: sigma-70 family RNA polymerase sigma factor [Gemmataceae bacterium]|nr:sigma-70 family RNA polymerase sigma factor [Gemmataceae bacterium]